MGTAVEYQKVMTEIVFINLPAPDEPTPGMTGGELMHGFLGDLYRMQDPNLKSALNNLCAKWNVHYRENGK
jgi:hypothetical protein